MKTKLRTAALAALVLLGSCAPKPDTEMSTVTPEANSRFAVERVGVIADDLAYSGRRGIYIFTDKETGKQYVGISGIGISDLGAHYQRAGKSTIRVPHEE